MSEQHIIQVRDLINDLQRQPEHAEVTVTVGGTRQFIMSIKRDSRRRGVNLDVTGEDRIEELEKDLARMEEDEFFSKDLLEKFIDVMGLELEPDRREALQSLRLEVDAHLNKP